MLVGNALPSPRPVHSMGIGGIPLPRSCIGVRSGGRVQFGAEVELMSVIRGCLLLALGRFSKGGTRLAVRCGCISAICATIPLLVPGSPCRLFVLQLLCILGWVHIVLLEAFSQGSSFCVLRLWP